MHEPFSLPPQRECSKECDDTPKLLGLTVVVTDTSSIRYGIYSACICCEGCFHHVFVLLAAMIPQQTLTLLGPQPRFGNKLHESLSGLSQNRDCSSGFILATSVHRTAVAEISLLRLMLRFCRACLATRRTLRGSMLLACM